MRILGFRLSFLIKHPIESYKAYQRQAIPVVNLDNPEKNCTGCGHDHELAHKNRVRCLCCKHGHCNICKPCCFCDK